ncbi:heterokaryon incompatibility protein-domain-containing protein [Xylaria flabelliformis]|nr:heterokaryon incompatibility protein-domain-containing protein [Xylaria flabelliformis]
MASRTTYVYTAIVTPRTIRLMQLHPGSETDPIYLSLVTTALDSVPDFESISYCWGSEKDKRQVICDGASLSITNSLYTGLAYFRYADRPRTLWADAICINQADAVEKSSQVLLMPQIYSQATRTLAWLGIADDPVFGAVSPLVADSIRQAFQLLPELNPENALEIAAKSKAIYPISQQLRAEGKPNILDHDWSLLTALLARPWFRRKWVIQEIALAKQVVLYAGGGVEIPWLELGKLAFNMELLGIMRLEVIEFGKTVLESTIIPMHCVTCAYTVQLFRQRSTLLDGVLVSIDFICTDPRDHVYSLLSLGGIGPSILPDYNASASEVFRRFAIAMLVEGQNLKLLSLAADDYGLFHRGSKRLEGLPSWAPDLRLKRADKLVSYTIRPQAFFAGGHHKPMLSVSHDQNILNCRGQVIDAVKTFSKSLVEMMLADMPELRLEREALVDPLPERRKERLAKWLENCYRLAFGNTDGSETMVNPDEASMAAFSRTIACGLDIMRNRLPPELIAAFPQYMQWATERAAIRHKDDVHHSPSLQNYSVTIDESIMALSAWLRFSVTEHGRFGNVPLNTQPGDRICVLLGSEVPLVIRATGRGTYTLVGECYIDGIMDGETFEAEGFEDGLLETIHFE